MCLLLQIHFLFVHLLFLKVHPLDALVVFQTLTSISIFYFAHLSSSPPDGAVLDDTRHKGKTTMHFGEHFGEAVVNATARDTRTRMKRYRKSNSEAWDRRRGGHENSSGGLVSIMGAWGSSSVLVFGLASTASSGGQDGGLGSISSAIAHLFTGPPNGAELMA